MNERPLCSCTHSQQNDPNASQCRKCGVLLYRDDYAMKTVLYDGFLNCSAHKYLESLRKKKCSVLHCLKEISESTSTLLESICQKFEYDIETQALGLYIHAKVCADKDHKAERFWSAVSLMVASKGIQLDKRVPYLNRYQRYADKGFPQADYEHAEKIVFEDMDFNIQFSTFISFLNFYLMCGVLFGADKLGCVGEFEDEVMRRAKKLIRNGSFLAYDAQKLALSIIKEVRSSYHLEPWSHKLEKLTGCQCQDVYIVPGPHKRNILKPLANTLNMRTQHKQVPIDKFTNINSSAQIASNSVAKFIRKKLLTSTNKQLNRQNRSKEQNQLQYPRPKCMSFSNSKSTTSLSVSSSSINQQIVPFLSFVSRRI